jgi:transcription antitermination factor NusG
VVASALEASGMSSWVPQVERVRVYRRSKRRVQLPLFSGYVFARGTREQAWMGSSTDRTVGLLEVVDQELLHRELCDLHLSLEVERSLDVYPYLIEGVGVRVVAGPLKGVEGIVDYRLGLDRLVMRVQTLGQSTSLEIDPSLLEPVG